MPSGTNNQEHLANVVGAFVSLINDEIEGRFEHQVGASGEAPRGLLAIDTWPGRSIDFLSSVLGLSHSGTVRLVARLQASGWIERRRGVDRRTAALHLSPGGRVVAEELRRARRAVLEERLRFLTDAERRVMEGAFDRLLRAAPLSIEQARRICRTCDHSVCSGEDCPIGSAVVTDSGE